MNDDEIIQIVLHSLRQVAPEAEPDAIDPQTPLQEQLDLDSMDFLNFLIGLTEATGVEIPERDYPMVTTIDACVRYLASHEAARSA